MPGMKGRRVHIREGVDHMGRNMEPFEPRTVDKNWLDMVPFTKVTLERTEDGRVRIRMPRFKSHLIRRIVAGMGIRDKEFVRVNLEERGERIFDLIDGKRNVYQIKKALNDGREEPVDTRDLQVYFATLEMHGLITYDENEAVGLEKDKGSGDE